MIETVKKAMMTHMMDIRQTCGAVVEPIIDSPKGKEEYDDRPVGREELEELTLLGLDTREDEEHGRSRLIDNEMHNLNGAEQEPCGEDIKERAALEDTKAERVDAKGCDEVKDALTERE